LSLDHWLDRWLSLIEQHARGEPILELGCGEGRDSAVLIAAGYRLIGVDLGWRAIAEAKRRVPAGEFHCQDIRCDYPVGTRHIRVVVASLSLHYFSWTETKQEVQRIQQLLPADGLLICRLNSTNDVNYGAVGYPPIEPNYFSGDGQPKRFFDFVALNELFRDGWRIVEVGEHVIRRYERPKHV
jgi:SAM-dependent methyltransferase